MKQVTETQTVIILRMSVNPIIKPDISIRVKDSW